MPTRVEKTKFYNPATGHHEVTDIPGAKTDLLARGYLPEGHPDYVADSESEQESQAVSQPAAKPEATKPVVHRTSSESTGK